MPESKSTGGAASAPPQHPKWAELQTYTNHLPHWRIQGSTYFVTWRLAKGEAALHPLEREAVVRVLGHFHLSRYTLFSFVVMDDHIHALVNPHSPLRLEAIVHSWKSYSANQLQRHHGRSGAVWQKDYFDRIMRNESEFQAMVDYIRGNPFKRWPDLTAYPWLGMGGAEAAPPAKVSLN